MNQHSKHPRFLQPKGDDASEKLNRKPKQAHKKTVEESKAHPQEGGEGENAGKRENSQRDQSNEKLNSLKGEKARSVKLPKIEGINEIA